MANQRATVERPKGINKDLSPFELPPEVWTDGDNINFRRSRTNGALGYSSPFSELTDTVIEPWYIQWFTDDINQFWVYADQTRIYKTDGTDANTIDITRLDAGGPAKIDYNADRFNDWTGCNFNSLIIMNNRNDHPQMVGLDIVPGPGTEGSYGEAQDLPNWGVTAAIPSGPLDTWKEESRCEVMRPFKNYLMALDCYDDQQIRYPSMVRWSSPAFQGAPPPSWDPYKTGEGAGLYNLADSEGKIVDGLTLGDYFVVYKTDAVWLMDVIGGEAVFRFRKLFGDGSGALSKDCIGEYNGKHFVMTPLGAYIHNASSKEEIMDNWVKDKFFNEVDEAYLGDTKVVVDNNNQEIWVYYISKASSTTWADKALVWDWDTKEWSSRDLNGISHVTVGQIEPNTQGVNSWEDQLGTGWNEATTQWNAGTSQFNVTTSGLLLASPIDKVLLADGYTAGTNAFRPLSWVKRIGIDMGDDVVYKYLTRIVPHVLGSSLMTVKLFVSDYQEDTPPQAFSGTFNPQFQQDVDCHVQGRYVGIQFESNEPFTLTGYSVEFTEGGEY
jgi:hypothetical protein